MGKALDRYLSQHRDWELTADNTPEWFKKYKDMQINGEVGDDSDI
jgi:hypothetical protein